VADYFPGMKRKIRQLYAFAVLMALLTPAFGPLSTQAAVTEGWVHRYNNVVSNSWDWGAKMVRDPVGNAVVSGTSESDMATLKYSGNNGSVLWQRRFSGEGGTRARALAADSSGNVVVTATSFHATIDEFGHTRHDVDFYTAKYAAMDGSLLWEKHHSGAEDGNIVSHAIAIDTSGNVIVIVTEATFASFSYIAKYAVADGALLWEKQFDVNMVLNAVTVDGRGNVVVTGSSNYDDGITALYTAKYASMDGATLWEKNLNELVEGASGAGQALAIDGTGNVVVSYSTRGKFGLYRTDYTAKYGGTDGVLIWKKRFATADDAAEKTAGVSAVALDGNGNAVVTGISEDGDGSNGIYYTAKYAATDGALLWEKRYFQTVDFSVNFFTPGWAVGVDSRGNVVVTGLSNNGAGGLYTAKYAANDGALLWEKHSQVAPVRTDSWLSPYSVALDERDDLVVAGTSFNGRNADFFAAKYAATDGAQLWDQRYDGNPVNYADLPAAVAVDGLGDVLVTGNSRNEKGESDIYTAKYAAADGALLWEQRHDDGYDYATAMAVDGTGNVVVTGSTYNAFGIAPNLNFYTAKYAATDGTLLWERRYNGPAKLNDSAVAVAVDGRGNVVITGSSGKSTEPGLNELDELYTAKYAAADGALLWEKRYHGPANRNDFAVAVAVDANSNVIVTGTSATSGSNSTGFINDYYTAKYAAEDGALIWAKRYNGPANRDDFPTALSVDADGNVVVTGYSARTGSLNSGFFYDYCTVKYSAMDGTLLWEKRYHGPADGSDGARSVAVDRKGNVIVTGSSIGGAGGTEFYTAKYATADGALLWEKRYHSPTGLGDRPAAVRVDGDGNVVVTGSSATSGSNNDDFINDYYTAKYAAADGALLWEKRYDGGGKMDDYPAGLALGPNGIVVVAGSSAGRPNASGYAGYDYGTVVYQESPPPISIDLVSTGIRIRFTGILGRRYITERAAVVTGPWSTLATTTAPSNGVIEYLDADRPVNASFYRTREP
jgi:uncharacterized delta-60 repeat protein